MSKIDRTLVTTKVTEYIKQCIADGDWKVGEKISSEHTLSRELGVSRASLRMSLQRFITLGILRSEQGRGCFLISDDLQRLGSGIIPDHSYKDVKEVLEFRLLVEPAAAKMAAKRQETEVASLLLKLNSVFLKMKSSVGDAENFIRYDMEFHRLIAGACGNLVLEESINRVFDNTVPSHRRINELFGFEDGLKFHYLIINAMRDGNPGKVEHYMARHIGHALEVLKNH